MAALKGMHLLVRRSWALEGDRAAEPTSESSDVESFLKTVLAPVCHNLTNKKYVAIRKCAVDVLDTILRSGLRVGEFKEILTVTRQPLIDMRSDANVELQKKSGELLDLMS